MNKNQKEDKSSEVMNLFCEVIIPFGFKNKYFKKKSELLFIPTMEKLFGVDFSVDCTYKEFEGIKPNMECLPYRKFKGR